MDYDVSSGVTSDGVILYSEYSMYVSSGGTANNTTVNGGGYLLVYSGGTANGIIENGGSVDVEDGANAVFVSNTFSGLQLSSFGFATVHSGTTANFTTLNYFCGLHVFSGGTANDTSINYYCSMFIDSGGTANDAVINSGGNMSVYSGGTANDTTVNEGNMFVDSGGTANWTMVDWGTFTVSSGGTANSTTVYRYGSMYVCSGGTATDIDWTPCEGHVYVADGGYATFVSQYSGVYCGSNHQLLSNVAVMDGMSFKSGGEINVMTGGIVNNTMLNDWGNSGEIYVYSGGTANITSVNQGGEIHVYSGGTANCNTVWGGMLQISSGGVANSTTLDYNASMFVGDGVTVNGDTVIWGKMHVGGIANSTTVTGKHSSGQRGSVYIGSGGTANSTTVNQYGTMYVSNGGTANGIIENGGAVYISNGANVVFVSHTISGLVLSSYRAYTSATIHSGTTANSATIGSCGVMHIFSGGITNDAMALETGSLYISSGGTANATTLNSNGVMYVFSGGTANAATVNAIGNLVVYSGGKITGKMTFESGAVVSFEQGGIVDFDLAQAGTGMLVNDLSPIMVKPATYTLTVNGTQSDGTYKLAGGATRFDRTISVMNTAGSKLGTLRVGRTVTIDGVDYTLSLADDVLSVTVEGAAAPAPAYVAKGDRDGNGISDVMFVWTGEHGEGNYAHGYWMNGSADWWSANAPGVSPDWDNLGSYDMSGDGKADAVMFGNVIVNDARGAYIGYYQDGNDMDGWVTIGFLDNSENVAWQNKVGNLTGNAAGKNSIVWYAPDLYALGAWTEGTTEWSTLCNTFGGAEWTLVGCGDFNGDGKDSVLMSYNGGQLFYSVDIGGALPQSLGNANWSGWEIRAIGDFAGDGKDDIVLFHEETGSMVLCADGDIDNYKSIGQLAAKDWFVVGAGDYNGDKKDDLLVRQYSTGMLGYYICADQNQWVEMGRGVGMEWTVIA